MVDAFRALHPNSKGTYSCWSEATRARQNNHGVRIDLIIASRRLFADDVQSASVLADVTGSDHCPVSVTLTYPVLAQDVSNTPPEFCTLYMPRFCYRQQSLKEMFAISVAAREPRHQSNNFGDGTKSTGLRSLGISKSSNSSGFVEKKDVKKRPTRRKQTTFTKFIVPSSVESKKTDTARVAPSESCLKNESAENNQALFREQTQSHRKVDKKRKETAKAWRELLKGPPPPPRCKHGLPCVLKTVTKSGENKGRTFFSCPYPAGIGKAANCNFFQWAPFKPGMYAQ